MVPSYPLLADRSRDASRVRSRVRGPPSPYSTRHPGDGNAVATEPRAATRRAGSTPAPAVEVRAEELCTHCVQAFLRAQLGDPAAWPARGPVPSAGTLAKSRLGLKVPARLLDAALDHGAKRTQY